jgi:hypothetical protein
VFDKEKREIFPYFNGVRDIKGDPIVIERAFNAALKGEDIAVLFKSAFSGLNDVHESLREATTNSVILPARQKLLDASYVAFRIKPPDEDGNVDGLSEEEVLDVLDAFNLWVIEQKKGQPSLPNSSEPSPESPSPSASSTIPPTAD